MKPATPAAARSRVWLMTPNVGEYDKIAMNLNQFRNTLTPVIEIATVFEYTDGQMSKNLRPSTLMASCGKRLSEYPVMPSDTTKKMILSSWTPFNQSSWKSLSP